MRHNDSNELAVLSTLFTNFLNGDESPVIAIGQSTLQADGTPISWLSSGLQALSLSVPFKPFYAINPINSITIGELELAFSAQSPWSPIAQSNSVTASLSKESWPFYQWDWAVYFIELPFGFNVSIDEIQNVFSISENGTAVAGLSTVGSLREVRVHIDVSSSAAGSIQVLYIRSWTNRYGRNNQHHNCKHFPQCLGGAVSSFLFI